LRKVILDLRMREKTKTKESWVCDFS